MDNLLLIEDEALAMTRIQELRGSMEDARRLLSYFVPALPVFEVLPVANTNQH